MRDQAKHAAAKRPLGDLPKVRISMECITTGRGAEERLYMPVVHVRRRRKQEKTQTAGRFYGLIHIILSIMMVAAIYLILSPYAYIERGYQAYGGECIAALAAGLITYQVLRTKFN